MNEIKNAIFVILAVVIFGGICFSGGYLYHAERADKEYQNRLDKSRAGQQQIIDEQRAIIERERNAFIEEREAFFRELSIINDSIQTGIVIDGTIGTIREKISKLEEINGLIQARFLDGNNNSNNIDSNSCN